MTAILKKHMPDRYKRVARMLGFALLLETPVDWQGFGQAIASHLTGKQRSALALMALRSLEPDDAALVANTAVPDKSSDPIAPLFNHMDEAAFWADMAEPTALEAYCLASFNAMTGPRQAAFLDFVQGRRAA